MLNKEKFAIGGKTLILIFLAVFTVECTAQVSQEWTKGYNGPGNKDDKISSMAVDAAGNVYVTGSSFSNATNLDYATIKYNSAGVEQWVRRYDFNNGDDIARALVIDGMGNVYVSGISYASASINEYATIKYSPAGSPLWIRRYSMQLNDNADAKSIAVDDAGNVYVTGHSYKIHEGYNILTIKYNSAGTLQWLKRYDNIDSYSDEAVGVAVDGTGNVYVAGYSVIAGGDWDYVTIKYNSSGTEMWTRKYDGPGHGYDKVKGLVLDASGNIYVTGYSAGDGTAWDFATIKYNGAGWVQWVKRYDGPKGNDYDEATAIAVDAIGNVYVTGFSSISEIQNMRYEYTTIKYNITGTEQWVQKFDGGNFHMGHPTSITLDGSGNTYITGLFRITDTTSEIGTIKYSSAGVQKWVRRYNGSGVGRNTGSSVAVDGSGNVYVGGYSAEVIGKYDYKIIKYSQKSNILPFSSEMPKQYSLSSNYPNPFNPVTKISFSIPINSYTKLVVYDISGKQVAELVDTELKAGAYDVDFDASQLASGTYFYRITAGNFTEVKKMMLVK